MFDNLTNKLQDALKKLRGQAVISESNIAPAMNDIRRRPAGSGRQYRDRR